MSAAGRADRPTLREAGTIGIAAPAGGVAPGGLEKAVAYFESRGHRVRLAANVHQQTRYLAGTDDARASALQALLEDPGVDAVFAARGGYGCARILDRLDFTRLRGCPKPVVGLSDVTALQLALLACTGLVSYTGFNVATDLRSGTPDPMTERSLWDALAGRPIAVSGLSPLRPGRAEGPLVGGCLSLLVSLMGTPWLPALDGAVLFLEDVHEEPYRLDRMLTQLRLAGVLQRAAGIVFGTFQDCTAKDPADGTVDDVLREAASWTDAPVWMGLPYGHTPSRCVLPVGAHCRVETGADGFGALLVDGAKPA